MTTKGDELIFLPLGGVGEIGMNAALYGFGPPKHRKWIMVDLGMGFASEEHRARAGLAANVEEIREAFGVELDGRAMPAAASQGQRRSHDPRSAESQGGVSGLGGDRPVLSVALPRRRPVRRSARPLNPSPMTPPPVAFAAGGVFCLGTKSAQLKDAGHAPPVLHHRYP